MPEPHPPSRSRRALQVAAFVATSLLGIAAIAALATLSLVGAPGAASFASGRFSLEPLGVPIWLGAVVLSFGFLARRRLPWLALAASAVVVLVLQLDALMAALMLGSVLAHGRGRTRWIQAGIAAALVAVATGRDLLRGRDGAVARLVGDEHASVAVAITLVAVVAVAALAVAYGLIVRASTRARRAEGDARRVERRADRLSDRLDVGDRRAELSQAMHDGVARTLTHVQLQAAVLREQSDLSADARATADELVAQARQASIQLQDVQRAIDGGFGHADAPASALPERGLADAVTLVQETRAAGHRVEAGVVLTGTTALTPALDRTAYWILSEALTNAAKHAPPGDAVAVTVSGDERRGVRILVENALGDGSAIGSGTGVARMRAQAVAVGGTLEAGVDARGRHVVDAWLPWASPRTDLGSDRAARQDRDRRG
ncbi:MULTISPECIES: sensor histidine kinase [unclassified Agrococcus]|uniref:sensor histidine kinase n=1 Tax=unclassified Agrococcus TaxID=2615065 RepID=UPI00361BB29C